jgi:hypothetical protein
MLKLTITKMGTPNTVVTKYGPKDKNWLQAQEYGTKYLNYWLGDTAKNWKVGDVIEVLAVEERTYPSKKTGKDEISYDIKLPKMGNDALMTRTQELEDSLEATQTFIKNAVVPAMKDYEARLRKLEPECVVETGLEHLLSEEDKPTGEIPF